MEGEGGVCWPGLAPGGRRAGLAGGPGAGGPRGARARGGGGGSRGARTEARAASIVP